MLPATPEARRKLAEYLRFQQEMGVERVRIAPGALAEAPPPASKASGSGEVLAAIQADLGPDCRRCKLHRGRQQIVFGSGNPKAELVFVGEAPGADEDAQGLPFVGRGGPLLTDMIEKGMGLARAQVYICNVIKCRPPDNRTPEPDECAACSPFLWRQLASIQPRMVCALGATAAQALRPFKGPLGSVRGRVHKLTHDGLDTNLVVTYHPAYLLRDPSQKREAWKDLQLIMSFLDLNK
ncbi:MAG: uracil-DNA glycosylase [Terriglobales bacterium]